MVRLLSSIRELRFLLLILLVNLKNVNAHQTSNTQQTPGHQLSTRVVQTKYGALRGAILHFQNPQQSTTNLHSTNSQAANDKSTSSGNSPNSKQANTNFLQPVEFFLGVPYATAPQGSLRFMPPVTPTHWRGVRLAHKHGSVCPQKLPSLSLPYNTSGPRSQSNNNTDDNQLPEARVATLKRLIPYIRNQSEDCLNLNIYLPFRAASTGNSNKYPVMVFVHGESYEWGTGNAFDGSILASVGQIIVITINYRLGVFGFLPSIADGILRGNYGLMDVIAALHWLQENIGQFGGDQKNVTLVGQGFGASFVHLLSLSPMAVGLFHRIALMSGSSLNYNAIAANSEMYARHLTRAMHCHGNQASAANSPTKQNRPLNMPQSQLTSSPNEILDCLRQKSVEELLRVELKVPQHLCAFGPVQDGIVVTLEPSVLVDSFNIMLSSIPGLNTGSEHSLLHHMLVNPLYAFLDQSTFYASDSNTPGHSGDKTNHTDTSYNNLAANLASLQHLQPYDMLFGFTRVEAPFIFTAHEEKFGVTVTRRDRILRTLVRNLFDYHQQVILLTLINEYTDWSKPVEHPLNLLDSVIDILSDALVVSPLIKAADFNVKLTQLNALLSGNGRRHHHQTFASSLVNDSYSTSATYLNQITSQLLNGLFNSDALNQPSSGHSKTRNFFYVFNYQSENSGYPQRIGCQSGEELQFLFGAPLAEFYYPNVNEKPLNGQSTPKRFSYFHLNYTKPELSLSEAVITYWSNFVKFGDPNIWPHELDSIDDRVKGRFENVYWPQYDTNQRKYLFLGMKPKIREHFHNHRLSYWLHLLPQLQRQADPLLVQAMANSLLTGAPENQLSVEQQQHVNELQQLFYLRYHLLLDHERPDTYDGIVRPLNFRLRSTRLNAAVSAGTAHLKAQSSAAINELLIMRNPNSSLTGSGQQTSVTSAQRKLTNGIQMQGSKLNSAKLDANNLTSLVSLTERVPYSMALIVTITFGCGLLLINLAIFAAVYRQLHRRTKCDANGNNNRLLNTSSCSTSGSNSTNSTNGGLDSNNGNEKETLKRRTRTNQALDTQMRNSFALLDSGNINSVNGDCQQCEKNNYILDDEDVKLTSDQLLVAQLDQNALYTTQLNNAYLAQTLHAQSQQPTSQWTTINENGEHITSDNSSNHLLDNQIIVTTLKPSPKHCTVNCCDYSYQFGPAVQFNSTGTNTSQSNYLSSAVQTNSQTTNGTQQQYVSQHYLVKNDLHETLT